MPVKQRKRRHDEYVYSLALVAVPHPFTSDISCWWSPRKRRALPLEPTFTHW